MLNFAINEEIQTKRMLVINENGEQIGVLEREDAMRIAERAGLDLVCVSPDAPTPVCKLMDYGKFKYDSLKREKESKKKQHITELGEIQIGINTAMHDIETKVNTARRLISKGKDIIVVLRLNGREIDRVNEAKEKIQYFANICNEFSQIKKPVFFEGRDVKVILEKIKLK